MCRELLGLQPRLGPTGAGTISKDDRIKQIVDEILEKLPDEFPLVEICSRLEEKTPFMVVIVQECERVNSLIIEAKRSLRELDKGLRVIRHFQFFVFRIHKYIIVNSKCLIFSNSG